MIESDVFAGQEEKPVSTYRCYRNELSGSGWTVQITVKGIRFRRYFADSHYGSSDASQKAAESMARKDQDLLKEYVALWRRFAPRRNSRSGMPGINRYEPTSHHNPFWLAYWTDPVTGRKTSRKFSVSAWGEEKALEMAIESRRTALDEMQRRYVTLSEYINQEYIKGRSESTSPAYSRLT